MRVAIVLGLLGAAGTTAGEPFAISAATLRTLTVTSRALVSPASVDLRGGWRGTRAACTARRPLAVRAQVDYVTPAGKTRRVVLSRTFRASCTDDGPGDGFTLTAAQLGDACPDGTWRPGHYTFVVGTTDRTTKLRAIASLAWPKSTRC